MESKDNNIIIYKDDNGITKVSVRFAEEDVWLTQNQLAEIYDTYALDKLHLVYSK